MRKLKFRVYDHDEKKMYEPYESPSYSLHLPNEDYKDYHVDYMQFIGMCDVNDKEIYENDIVKYKRANLDFIGVVEYNDYTCSFVVESLPINGQNGGGKERFVTYKNKFEAKYIEILGNTYQGFIDDKEGYM